MADILFQFNINTIKVGSIENSSSLNIGKNMLKEFESMSKTNQGLGKITGDNNEFPHNCNCVKDPDEVDMLYGKDGISDEKLKNRGG